MEIRSYQPADRDIWDTFVANSKNGTFLFFRNYMDYHVDRFQDHSLMVFDKNSQLKAVLPANSSGDQFASHAGLTYGGFVVDQSMTMPLMLEMFQVVHDFIGALNFRRWIYKPVPHIYHTIPAEEDLYALYRLGAHVYRRDVLTVMDYRQPVVYQERRRRSIHKAQRTGIECLETDNYEQFWTILASNLERHHNVRPVHSVDEIKLLASHFPNEIKLYGAYQGTEMLAGAVVYLSRNVCHVQYNAAAEAGRQVGALDVVLDHLLCFYRPNKRYFDFGVSTENNGQYLNAGLIEYKEGFGGRTVVHDLYAIDLN